MDRIFNFIFQSQERQLHRFLETFLFKYYGRDMVVSDDRNFLIAGGNIPVALVSHLDTVHRKPNRDCMYVDERKGVAWSPNGLGADDRAGVYAIIQLVKAGFRPHIIFTHGEESGGTGAHALTKFSLPFDVKFMIELDRRGSDEAVFYDCGNKEFQDKILSFGPKKGYGTFSDISILGPAYDIATVNLGIGYYNEHTTNEYLVIDEMWDTINVVSDILDWVFQEWETIPNYKHEKIVYSYTYNRDYDGRDFNWRNYPHYGGSQTSTKRDESFFTNLNERRNAESVENEEEVEITDGELKLSEMALDDFDYTARHTWSPEMYERYFNLLYGDEANALEEERKARILLNSGEIISDRAEVVNEFLREECLYGGF
jgi:hypothetical protein